MDIKDIVKSVRANLYDRASSPLMGTFLVSWSLCNYKFFIILFSRMEPVSKFEMIKSYVLNGGGWSNGELWLNLLGFPLLASLFIIFVLPYPSKWVFEFSRKRQKELKEIKQKIDDETPLTKEEARKLRLDLMNLESKYEEKMLQKDNLIEALRKEIDSFKNQSTSPLESSQRNIFKKSDNLSSPNSITHNGEGKIMAKAFPNKGNVQDQWREEWNRFRTDSNLVKSFKNDLERLFGGLSSYDLITNFATLASLGLVESVDGRVKLTAKGQFFAMMMAQEGLGARP